MSVFRFILRGTAGSDVVLDEVTAEAGGLLVLLSQRKGLTHASIDVEKALFGLRHGEHVEQLATRLVREVQHASGQHAS